MFYLKILNDEQLNKQKIAANVSNFLLNDFPVILSRADRQITDITSPKLDGIPAHSASNTQEKMILDHINYDAVCDCVADTYTHMSTSSDHKLIIKLLYFYDMDRTNVSNKLGVDTSTLNRRRIDALVEFANRFQRQKQSKAHQCDWIPDFRLIDG